MLEKDPKNIFNYQSDAENYKEQVLNFLLFDKHEYTDNLRVCNSGQYIYTTGLCIFPFVTQDLIDIIE